MTLNEFIIKWQGEKIDFDGVYPNQCMDLAHQYYVDVLGLTDARILAAPSAKQVYLNFSNIYGNQYFEKIDNTPTGTPKEGDIVFFSSGTYGHVCIFIEGDTNKFHSFDANWPVGTLPHVQEHTYGYCLGWLRYKSNAVDVLTECRLARDSHWTDLMKIKDALVVTGEYSLTKLLGRVDMLSQFEVEVGRKDKQIKEANTQISKLETDIKALQEANEVNLKANQLLQVKIDEQAQTIQGQGQEIKSLSRALSELKNTNQEPELKGFLRWLHNLIIKL